MLPSDGIVYCVVLAFVFNVEFLCMLDNENKVQACLPLLLSMVEFETTHGDYQTAVREVEQLVGKFPTVAELWLLLIK